jgi:hypothetical protein
MSDDTFDSKTEALGQKAKEFGLIDPETNSYPARIVSHDLYRHCRNKDEVLFVDLPKDAQEIMKTFHRCGGCLETKKDNVWMSITKPCFHKEYAYRVVEDKEWTKVEEVDSHVTQVVPPTFDFPKKDTKGDVRTPSERAESKVNQKFLEEAWNEASSPSLTAEMYKQCLNEDNVIWAKLPDQVKRILSSSGISVQVLLKDLTWSFHIGLEELNGVYRIHPATEVSEDTVDIPLTVGETSNRYCHGGYFLAEMIDNANFRGIIYEDKNGLRTKRTTLDCSFGTPVAVIFKKV